MKPLDIDILKKNDNGFNSFKTRIPSRCRRHFLTQRHPKAEIYEQAIQALKDLDDPRHENANEIMLHYRRDWILRVLDESRLTSAERLAFSELKKLDSNFNSWGY